jgi:hypothetical protein
VSSRISGPRVALTLAAIALASACAETALEPVRGDEPNGPPPADTARPPAAVVAVVELDAATLVIDEGTTRQLLATPRDSGGRALEGRAVTWASSDPDVATVSAGGTVAARRSGVATITATADGKSAEARVTVAATYAHDLLFDVWTGTPTRMPQLHRLDIRVPGEAAVPVLSANAMTSHATVSPDGSRIAFVAIEDGHSNLYVANRDGTGFTRVTSTRDNDDQPAWSPDGTRIAFRRWNYIGTPHDVWVVNVDGTGAVNLTADLPGEQRSPTWSPRQADGGHRIAFAHVTRGAEYLRARLYTMRADGTDKRAITPDGERLDDEPAWSPDGRSIAFVRTGGDAMGDLWLVSPDGGDERPLMATQDPPFEQRSPAWSPDGAMIAFTSAHEIIGNRAGDWQVYTVRADGTSLLRRTSDPTDKQHPTWLKR